MNFSLLAWYARNSRPDQQPSVAEHSSSEEEQHLLKTNAGTIPLAHASEHNQHLKNSSILQRELTCSTPKSRRYIAVLCAINTILTVFLGFAVYGISQQQNIIPYIALTITLCAIIVLLNAMACCKAH